VKRLIVIPVIHTLADLGSLADSVRDYYVAHFGPAVWQQRQGAVKGLWNDIRRAIEALHLDFRHVRIYQDGLPVCGVGFPQGNRMEEQIVRELAGAGSLNHQLVLELVGNGAVLTGTEDPQLLIREYQLQRSQMDATGVCGEGSRVERRESRGAPTLNSQPSTLNPSVVSEAADILAARDRFITQRITATLQEGETGLLFLGAAHRIDTLSLEGIDTVTLDRAG